MTTPIFNQHKSVPVHNEKVDNFPKNIMKLFHAKSFEQLFISSFIHSIFFITILYSQQKKTLMLPLNIQHQDGIGGCQTF